MQDIETLLLNIYNQTQTFLGFEALEHCLGNLPFYILQLPTIGVTDFNMHSSLWNPQTYHTHDADSDRLVDAMTRGDLYLRSPQGVPTFEQRPGMKSGTTIDLVWVNQQAIDLLVACLVDTDDTYNHHSDHQAIVTVINVKCDDTTFGDDEEPNQKVCSRTDHKRFLMELKTLMSLSPLTLPTTISDISTLHTHIPDSITRALNLSSPLKKRAHKNKAWWNPFLLDPLRPAAAKARWLQNPCPQTPTKPCIDQPETYTIKQLRRKRLTPGGDISQPSRLTHYLKQRGMPLAQVSHRSYPRW